MGVLVADLPASGDPGRPGHDEGIGGTAAVDLALPAPEGRVAGPRPAPRVVVVGRRSAQVVDALEVLGEVLRHHVEEEHLVERAGRTALGGGPVVGDDHDERVVQHPDLLEGVEHAAEVVVEVGQEPGVDLHHARVQPPLVRAQRRPLGDVGVVPRQLRVSREQADLLLPREHGLPVGIPALVELSRVLGDPVFRRMVRSVPGPGREQGEEGLLGGVDVRVQDELDGLVGEILAEVVPLLRRAVRADRTVVLVEVRIPLVGLATEEAVETFEALVPAASGGTGRRRCCPRTGKGATYRRRTCCSRPPEGARRACRSRTASGRRIRDSRSRSP